MVKILGVAKERNGRYGIPCDMTSIAGGSVVKMKLQRVLIESCKFKPACFRNTTAWLIDRGRREEMDEVSGAREVLAVGEGSE